MAQVSEQDYELLSAYVDGMVSETERLALEGRLRTEPALLRELTALYLTLALVKQLPTMTAPRNFTLPDTPSRWLIFPTTTTFTVLSAAAATFLVALGFMLLLTTTMSAGAPQPAANQEVALLTNQVSATDTTFGTNERDGEDQVAALPSAEISLGGLPETATALASLFSATADSFFAASEATTETGGSGGEVPAQVILPTTLSVDDIQIAAEPTQESAADGIDMAIMPLSTSTAPETEALLSTAGSSAPLGTPAPSDEVVVPEESAEDATEMRYFEPSEPPAANTEDQQQTQMGESAVAQVATPTPLPTEASNTTALMTTTPQPSARGTDNITATPSPTSTPSPTLPPTSFTRSSGTPPLLGAGLVLAGAVLFGIAFMTAVTRRSQKRRAKREG